MKSFREVAGVKTSKRPITCKNETNTVKLKTEEQRPAGLCSQQADQIEERQLTHVFMFHMFKQLQLSVGSFGVDNGLKRPRELLHSDLQTGLHVNGGAV